MSLYINKVWLNGVVHTQPRIRNISERTKATSFTMAIVEQWESRDGDQRNHRNEVVVEVLGRDAQAAFDNLNPGDWVSVDGYLRSDYYRGKSSLSVRVYNISYGESANVDGGEAEKAPGKLRFSVRDEPS